jgi:hypothetical protein
LFEVGVSGRYGETNKQRKEGSKEGRKERRKKKKD